MIPTLSGEHAASFARLTLGHVGQEYPNKLDHVLSGPQDALAPSALHPIFYGSFDWHSCVHGWWQLMRLRRCFADLPQAEQISARADLLFTADNVQGERAYLERPYAALFERPYGWAWLLALHHELARQDRQDWATALEPLARAFAALFRAHLPKLTYPIRHGVHSNTAFALTLALEWAEDRDPELATLIRSRAWSWYGKDRASQAWEPSGDEFLSPTLTEALLMSRTLSRPAFQDWFDGLLPILEFGEPQTLLEPALVSDRTDGKIAHLDGLNLSRAWCWRQLAAGLPADHVARPIASAAAERHLAASLPHVAGDYMGEHWLATFALLALEAPDDPAGAGA